MHRNLRLGRAAVLLTVLALLGVGVHLVHAYQVARNIGVLLNRANQAANAADEAKAACDLAKAAEALARAADYYGRYLGFHPDDADAMAKLGVVLDEQAKSQAQKLRAVLVLEKAVRLDPGRDDVRRRLAALAATIGRTLDAREHLNYLLNGPAHDDSELEYLLGCSEEADAHFREARAAYEKAIRHGPQRVDAYVRLASLLRRRADQLAGVDDGAGDVKHYTDSKMVMDDLVKAADPPSTAALLAHSRYLREVGLFSDAVKDVAAARVAAPEEVEVQLASAEVAEEKGDLDGARRELEQGLKSHPEEVRFHVGLAGLELQRGPAGRDEAVAHLHKALEAFKAMPSNAVDVWNVANLLIDAGEKDEARELLREVTAEGPGPAADFLRARLDFDDGKFSAAAALLEDRRQELAASPELARQTDRLLGLCYAQLGNPDQQLAAFRRAVEESPSWPPARLGLAAALIAAGKTDEALAEYHRLDPLPLEARFAAVRLLIFRNLQAPADKRNWKEAEGLLNGAPEDGRGSVDFRLAQVDLLAAQRRFDEAWKQLARAVAEQPKEMRYRLALAEIADLETTDDHKPALTSRMILDKAESEVGDTVDLRLARAVRLARLSREDAAKVLAQLEEKGDRFAAADQTRLLLGLGEAYDRVGATEDAVRLYKQVRDRSADDLEVRLRLFDLSLKAKDETVLKEVVDEVRRIEGVDGVLWRFGEASLLLLQAQFGDKTGLHDAHVLLTEAAKRRPGWSRPPLLEAEIDELEGDVDAAAAKCAQAIDLGDHRPEVIRQTVQLLVYRRRYEEARQVLQKFGTGGDLGRLATEVSLLNRDPKERTLQMIQAAADADKDSTNYRDHLWLGQMYEAMQEQAKAEAAFRQAIRLDPSAAEPRTALVLLLTGQSEKDKAKAELDDAAKVLSVDKAAAVQAVGYEALGQREKAEEHYLSMLKAKQDVADVRAAAAFYLRGGDMQKAAPLLHQIIDAPHAAGAEPVLWARRSLAVAFAASGNYKQSKDALDLLDQNLREGNEPEDERLRAVVLALRPGERKDSIRTLEASFARLRAAPDEDFLLARLYEADQDWDRANEHFLAVVGVKGGANPLHLAYYIQYLVRRANVKEAAAWLRRLEAMDPDSGRTLGVKARVLQVQGQGEAAGRLVQDYAEKIFRDRKDAAVLGDAAALLEELGRQVEAEDMYRKYVKTVESDAPEKNLVLAAFLARRDRLTESLDVIEAVWARCKPELAAGTAVAVLRVGRPTPQHFQRVEGMLRDAIAKNPTTPNLLVSMADLRDAQGQDAEAERLYREVLKGNPRNPLALNNLAWLLAFQPGKASEALELVNRRMEITGPSASVLDTRGMVLLKLGRADDAAQCFTDAAAQSPTAVYYFHLAEAQRAAGKPNDAEKSRLKAKELGIKKESLHPLERAHPDFDDKWFADNQAS
jgi:tetratricopeptide (TPR) repeat protein